ncbi:MAG: 1-deoxy-D-xylulose-5-phosphate reductoisomerase [Chlamydiae bacterium]|nr:1-deoxy-D-xylulose-5-phosphate reductoisomerase [Chlamydiota bacterium]
MGIEQKKKRIAILGSTGSIGMQTLAVARHLGLDVTVLTTYHRTDLLLEQIREFHPRVVAVGDKDKAFLLQKEMPGIRILAGPEGIEEAASFSEVDFVVSAITGFAGIAPTLAAIRAGKRIGLANKEVLVAAGELVMSLAREYGVTVLPIDSEHSALFQCLEGKETSDVHKLILTASGGAFFRYRPEELAAVTKEQALTHPNWKMGPKVTVDSSTLMNKGLEVIEAHHLFHMPVESIDVVIHPQSLVHSMIEMKDGTLFAQISEPSMLSPIQYAITWPSREKGLLAPFSFAKYGKWEFFPWERGKFLCLDLAYAALEEGGSFPCALNAANEVLVSRFLQGEIRWIDIGSKLERLLARHMKENVDNMDTICAVDARARQEALIV